MSSPLRELARLKGKTLGQVGVSSAYVIACGVRRAGPGAISRIADALGVTAGEVAAACDAAWRAKRLAGIAAAGIPPEAHGRSWGAMAHPHMHGERPEKAEPPAYGRGFPLLVLPNGFEPLFAD